MNRERRNQIIDFLKPYMEEHTRRTLVEGALHGCDVIDKIDYWERNTDTFADGLVTTLDTYGQCEGDDEPSLVVLIRYVGEQHGVDVRNRAEALCNELLKTPDSSDPPELESPSLPDPSPNPRMRNHIFLSYSHRDDKFVTQLTEDLRRRGHIVWVDFGGIRGGDVWRQSIADGIHASAVVIVVVTGTALESPWVHLEIETALKLKKPIFPVIPEHLANDKKAVYNNLLEAIQYRDFTVGYNEALPELLEDLPKPEAGLPGYCQKLIARLAQAPWGLDHYIQEEAKLLPIHASPYDEGMKRGESENLLKRLWQGKRMIVLGEPGMGKSVALERLAWELASNDPVIVPVLINLREYDGLPLLEWVRFKLLESDEQPIRDALQQSSDIERFLNEMPFQFYLLLDGLNEVRPEHRATVLGEIRRLAMAYPQHAMVVTSRVQDESWRELRGGSFGHDTVVVQPITEAQSKIYLQAHLGQDEAQNLWQRFDARMRGLASTPLLLWLIKEAWLETRGNIPGNRGALYANFIERMLRRDDDRKLNNTVSRDVRISALQKLALMMHKDEAVSYTRQQVKAIITDNQTLTVLLVNGLLQGDEIIRFAPHQTVQEHFAARAIQSQVEGELGKNFFGRMMSRLQTTILDTASDSWWAETYIQLAGLTTNPNQLAQKVAERNPWLAWWCVQEGQKVDPKTERIIQEQSALLVDSDDVADRRNAVQALLQLPQARVIDQLAKLAIDSDASVAEPARQALDELGEPGKLAVASIFEERITRFKPPERAEIGRWLSEWGDMRRGVGVITVNGVSIPDIDWVTIPAGEFIYQDGEKRTLPAFKISRYPITYIQFQCFVDDADQLLGTPVDWYEGLSADDDKAITDQYFKYDNHPRENVNWYQAMAFCRWLSFKLGGGYALDDVASWAVRLPTEYEWEKAAGGIYGRNYPYGNEFDATKGNTHETSIGQTSAVGIFSDGASSYGLQDMSGNVWEWCLSDYLNPAEHPNGEDLSISNSRVLRGGSFFNFDSLARASDCLDLSPDSRSDGGGFRVVVSPHSQGG